MNEGMCAVRLWSHQEYKPPKEVSRAMAAGEVHSVLLLVGSFNPVRKVDFDVMEWGVKRIIEQTNQHPLVLVVLEPDESLRREMLHKSTEGMLDYKARRRLLLEPLQQAKAMVKDTDKMLDPRFVFVDDHWQRCHNPVNSNAIHKMVSSYFQKNNISVFYTVDEDTAREHNLLNDTHVSVLIWPRGTISTRSVWEEWCTVYARNLKEELYRWFQYPRRPAPRWIRSDVGPPQCEDLGHTLPESLQEGLTRRFQLGEINKARQSSGLHGAQSHPQHWLIRGGVGPQAVWLVGPSGTGKSSLVEQVAREHGIGPIRPTMTSTNAKFNIDAVVVDGDFFRKSHRGYQAVVKDGFVKNCTWRTAYNALRGKLQKQKAALLHAAVHRRLNVVIPSTCLRLAKCKRDLLRLQQAGYENHMILVLGEPRLIIQRGLQRAQATGKRYEPQEWDKSLTNSLRMVALVDSADFFWTTPSGGALLSVVATGDPHDVLQEAIRRLPGLLVSGDWRQMIANLLSSS